MYLPNEPDGISPELLGMSPEDFEAMQMGGGTPVSGPFMSDSIPRSVEELANMIPDTGPDVVDIDPQHADISRQGWNQQKIYHQSLNMYREMRQMDYDNALAFQQNKKNDYDIEINRQSQWLSDDPIEVALAASQYPHFRDMYKAASAYGDDFWEVLDNPEKFDAETVRSVIQNIAGVMEPDMEWSFGQAPWADIPEEPQLPTFPTNKEKFRDVARGLHEQTYMTQGKSESLKRSLDGLMELCENTEAYMYGTEQEELACNLEAQLAKMISEQSRENTLNEWSSITDSRDQMASGIINQVLKNKNYWSEMYYGITEGGGSPLDASQIVREQQNIFLEAYNILDEKIMTQLQESDSWEQIYERAESLVLSDYEDMADQWREQNPGETIPDDFLPKDEELAADIMEQLKRLPEYQNLAHVAGMESLGNPIDISDEYWAEYPAWSFVEREVGRVAAESERLGQHYINTTNPNYIRNEYITRMAGKYLGIPAKNTNEVIEFIEGMDRDNSVTSATKSLVYKMATQIFKDSSGFVSDTKSTSSTARLAYEAYQSRLNSPSTVGSKPDHTGLVIFQPSDTFRGNLEKGDPYALEQLAMAVGAYKSRVDERIALTTGAPSDFDIWSIIPHSERQLPNGEILRIPTGGFEFTLKEPLEGTDLPIVLPRDFNTNSAIIDALLETHAQFPLKNVTVVPFEVQGRFVLDTFRLINKLSQEDITKYFTNPDGTLAKTPEEITMAKELWKKTSVHNLMTMHELFSKFDSVPQYRKELMDSVGIDKELYSHIRLFTNAWYNEVLYEGGFKNSAEVKRAIMENDPQVITIMYDVIEKSDNAIAEMVTAARAGESILPEMVNASLSSVQSSSSTLQWGSVNIDITNNNLFGTGNSWGDVTKPRLTGKNDDYLVEQTAWGRPSFLQINGTTYDRTLHHMSRMDLVVTPENAGSILEVAKNLEAEIPSGLFEWVEGGRDKQSYHYHYNSSDISGTINATKTTDTLYKGKVEFNSHYGEQRLRTREEHAANLVLMYLMGSPQYSQMFETAYSAVYYSQKQKLMAGEGNEDLMSGGGTPVQDIQINPKQLLETLDMMRNKNKPERSSWLTPSVDGITKETVAGMNETPIVSEEVDAYTTTLGMPRMLTIPEFIAASAIGGVQDTPDNTIPIRDMPNSEPPFGGAEGMENYNDVTIRGLQQTKALESHMDLSSRDHDRNRAHYYFNWNPTVASLSTPRSDQRGEVAGLHYFYKKPKVLRTMLTDNLQYQPTDSSLRDNHYGIYQILSDSLGITTDQWNSAASVFIEEEIQKLQEFSANNLAHETNYVRPGLAGLFSMFDADRHGFFKAGNIKTVDEVFENMPSLGEIHLGVIYRIWEAVTNGEQLLDVSGNPIEGFPPKNTPTTVGRSIKQFWDSLSWQGGRVVNGFRRFKPTTGQGTIAPRQYKYESEDDSLAYGMMTFDLYGSDKLTLDRRVISLPWSFHEGYFVGLHSSTPSLIQARNSHQEDLAGRQYNANAFQNVIAPH